jgi:sensor domain CHASE-containing protein
LRCCRCARRLPGPRCALTRWPAPAQDRRDAALRTVARRELTMQGPILTVQGFTGMIYRAPIFLNTTDPDELWG